MIFYVPLCRITARREPFVKPVDPPKLQLSEAIPKLSSPSMVSNSIGASCLPSDVDSKPKSIEASLSKNTGLERISSEGDSIKNRELEDVEMDAPAKVNHVTIPRCLGNMDMGDPSLTLSVPKYLEEGIPGLCFPVPSLKYMHLKSPQELPSIEIHTGAGSCVCSYLESHMEEDNDGSTSMAEASKVSTNALDCSVTGQSIGDKMAEPSLTVPTINSSLASKPSDDLRLESEQAAAACSPSGSANGISRLDDTSLMDKGNKGLPSCWENGYRRKPKPLFSRGFLDRPARKKSVDGNGQNHTGSHGVAVVPMANGYYNGHSGLSEQESDNCSTGLKSFFENGKDIFPGDMSFTSRDFLKSSYTKSADQDVKKTELQKFDHHGKTKCNGSVEQGSVSKLDFRPETCSNGIDFTKVNHEEFHETAFVHENGSKVYKKDGPPTPTLQNMNVGLGEQLKPPSGCLNECDMEQFSNRLACSDSMEEDGSIISGDQ